MSGVIEGSTYQWRPADATIESRPLEEGPGLPTGDQVHADKMMRCPYYRAAVLDQPGDVGLYGPNTCGGGCTDQPICMVSKPDRGWTLFVPEGVVPCPICSYDVSAEPGGPAERVTHGCESCRFTGRKTLWLAGGRLRGGHVEVRIWSGMVGQRGMNGTLTLRQEEWEGWKLQIDLSPLWEWEEHDVSTVTVIDEEKN